MKTLNYSFAAERAVHRPAHIGVVASGDLEILVDDKADAGVAQVRVRTSVDGFDTVWENVLRRFFVQQRLGGRWHINDFGATPGVVTLRLQQAAQLAMTGDGR
ncbi:malonate decarboxylase acyl carrier protein [Mycobacteroides abscessus]|uniref:malonate decarboxylase acyl carrier protein n=1 Tax=Mycobacteroides abscessus TaxID=36809 RepID=UPI000C2690E4|nr:malonate decarboxylase acyl carrier protein [Mycobacteroides abscessus]